MAETAAPRVAGYDRTAIWLHWLIAGLVTLQLLTKLVDPASIGATAGGMNAWHLAIGPMVLLLMFVRFGWRLRHPTPPPPADLSAPLRLVSQLTHWGFYALLILIPIVGWVSASGFGAHPTLLGLVRLPMIAPASKSLAESWGAVHGTLAWVVVALIGLHLCGVSYHVLAKDDGLMMRMVRAAPGRATSADRR